MQTLVGRTSIINSTNPAKTNNAKLKSKIRFGKIIAFGIAAKIIIGGAFIFSMMASQNFFSMDDYKLSVVFSIFVLVPLGIFKTSGMVKKLQTMSSSNNDSKPRQIICLGIDEVILKRIYYLKLTSKTSK